MVGSILYPERKPAKKNYNIPLKPYSGKYSNVTFWGEWLEVPAPVFREKEVLKRKTRRCVTTARCPASQHIDLRCLPDHTVNNTSLLTGHSFLLLKNKNKNKREKRLWPRKRRRKRLWEGKRQNREGKCSRNVDKITVNLFYKTLYAW